jgi:hypothetical protein
MKGQLQVFPKPGPVTSGHIINNAMEMLLRILFFFSSATEILIVLG